MSLTNIDRDAFWVTDMLASSEINFPTVTGRMATDGIVHEQVAGVTSANASGAGGIFGIGVWMKPPTEDNVPFRVKAFCDDVDNLFLGIGYSPGAITGDDLLLENRFMHIGNKVDEIIMFPAHDASHVYYGRPIGIGIFSSSVVTQSVSLSVQNLGVSAPPFAKGVS